MIRSRRCHRPLWLSLSLLFLAACLTTPPTTADGAAESTGPLPKGEPAGGSEIPRDRPLRAGFLVIDGVYNSELMAPYDVLQHTVFQAEPGIEVMTISPDGKPIRTFEGITIQPHHSFGSAPPLDILVVPSAEHNMDTDLENDALIRWVRETGTRARFVMSLCDGAFVLAKAGLLDGHAATTFPSDQKRFAQMFPEVDLRINVSFVHDGRMLTSEGGARSYDVAMYLVDLLYGEEATRGIGRGLLIEWPPRPGQAPRYIGNRRPPQ